MKLTKEDARAIADALRKAAEAVDKYLDDNYKKISREEYESLYESFHTIQRISSFATTVAVGLALDALTKPAAELKKVIKQAKEKIETLKTIGHVIRVVAGVVDLAASVMARDPNAIVTSVTNLGNLMKETEDV